MDSKEKLKNEALLFLHGQITAEEYINNFFSSESVDESIFNIAAIALAREISKL